MDTQSRPMAVLHNGIWQKCEGVWVSIDVPYRVRVVLNGKEMFFEGKTFFDLKGHSDQDVDFEIIRMNIATLPKLKRNRSPMDLSRAKPIAEPPRYRYQVINRNGIPHAVPHRFLEELPDEPRPIALEGSH